MVNTASKPTLEKAGLWNYKWGQMARSAKTRAKPSHTEEQKLQIAKAICDMYSEGIHPIESCCQENGICDKTFRNWMAVSSEITAFYQKSKVDAVQIFKDKVRQKAQSSLEKLIEGYETEEIRETVGTGIDGGVNTTTTTTKRVGPNAGAVLFALQNTDADQWKDTRRLEHSGPDGKPIQTNHSLPDLASLSPDELKTFRELMRKARGVDSE